MLKNYFENNRRVIKSASTDILLYLEMYQCSFYFFYQGEAAMLKGELERLREKINSMIISEGINRDELMKESRKLDIVIAEYMKYHKKKRSDENNIREKQSE